MKTILKQIKIGKKQLIKANKVLESWGAAAGYAIRN